MEESNASETGRILLVEDDPTCAEVVRAFLSAPRGKERPRVEHVTTLGAAFESAARASFDVVLLDLNLPDSQGVDTLDRALAAFRETPVIVLTGTSEKKYGIAAIERGAQDFLVKSKIDSDKLWRAIRFARERARHIRRLDAMMRGVADGVVVVDGSRTIRYANKAAASFLRIQPEKVIGSRFPLRLERRRKEFTLTDAAGKTRYVVIRIAPVDWDAEDPRLVTMHDITEIRTLEATRAEIRARKRHEEMKDAFLGNLFHEMRSPLTVAHSVLRILGTDPQSQIDNKTRELVDAGLRNMDRLIRTVCDLLDLSRLESGRAPVRRRRFSMLEAILESVDDARHLVERGVDIQVETTASGSLDVRADRDMVLQLLHNLLANAARFARSVVRLRVGRSDETGSVEIDVIDDGPGIPETELELIFDRYRQAVRARGKGYKGTGLGLPICRDLVHLNGGKIAAANEPGGGARVSFAFPCARRARGVETAAERRVA
jgi:signal transduction histidine kinase